MKRSQRSLRMSHVRLRLSLSLRGRRPRRFAHRAGSGCTPWAMLGGTPSLRGHNRRRAASGSFFPKKNCKNRLHLRPRVLGSSQAVTFLHFFDRRVFPHFVHGRLISSVRLLPATGIRLSFGPARLVRNRDCCSGATSASAARSFLSLNSPGKGCDMLNMWKRTNVVVVGAHHLDACVGGPRVSAGRRAINRERRADLS